MPKLALFRKIVNFAKRRRTSASSSSEESATMSQEENQQDAQAEEKFYPIQIVDDAVSTLHKCKSASVTKLCIFDIGNKLQVNGHYDIGGTYDSNGAPEIWFYYTTTTLPGYNYLLNLFICHRKVGIITLDMQGLTYEKEDEGIVSVFNTQTSPSTVTFRSFQPDQHYFVKTYCFAEENLEQLKHCTLFIHFSLTIEPKNILSKDFIRQIKLNHNMLDIFKDMKTDFALVTKSGKEHPIHKMILAAHSSVLRDSVKKASSPHIRVDLTDDVVELVIQYLYTGTVKDILKKDCQKICEAAEKLKLDNLLHLAKMSMREMAGGV